MNHKDFEVNHSVVTRYYGLSTDVTVPEGVAEIGPYAFLNCRRICSITLPDGVTRIAASAFSKCISLERIKIPGSVTAISQDAFQDCRRLSIVEYPNYAANAEGFRGTPYAVWAEKWMTMYPNQPVPAVFPKKILGTLTGEWPGEFLCTSGFSFFQAGRTYHISAPDEDGIVAVSSWCGGDGPDESGFGREECYDWWYLDEQLEPIPGIDWLHSYSRADLRMPSVAERWAKMRRKAAKRLGKNSGQ